MPTMATAVNSSFRLCNCRCLLPSPVSRLHSQRPATSQIATTVFNPSFLPSVCCYLIFSPVIASFRRSPSPLSTPLLTRALPLSAS
ncbi:hypothetical protein HYC85_017723 [Camellia sinensis]|uniref:Uncharacterized protein n=1 Tax=Camellia sinensis TaxID=4442 RepID=A0A7J7GVU7_CAMSI|nr:hypothetical protein HYC85_017723 [Camellia sinensis]